MLHQLELEERTKQLYQEQLDLEESQKRYSHLYHFAPVGYFTLDKNMKILELNLTAAKLLGIHRNTLQNKLNELNKAK